MTIQDVFGAFLLMIGIGSGFMATYHLGRVMEAQDWEEDLVSRGLAEYNSKTGKWKWIEAKTTPKEKISVNH